ncbi:MAG: hypothetical protein WBM28_00495 [Burkholderiales bacterium]
MSGAPIEASPQRTLLTAKSEYLDGFNRLLGLVRRELRIFDPDLSGLGMNLPPRIEALARFLRESRAHCIYIAIHDTEHVTKHCPRLLTLLGSYSAGMFIHQTLGDAAKVQDCFVLADNDHLVRRPVRAQARGVLVLNDPDECQPMHQRFGEIWEASVPGVSANTTGL